MISREDKFISEYGYGNNGIVALPCNKNIDKDSTVRSIYEEKNPVHPSKEYFSQMIEFIEKEADNVIYQFQQWDVCWWGFDTSELKNEIWNPYEFQNKFAKDMGYLSDEHKSLFSILADFGEAVFLINGRGGIGQEGEINYAVSNIFIGSNLDEYIEEIGTYLNSEYYVDKPPVAGADGGWDVKTESIEQKTPRQFEFVPENYEECVRLDGKRYATPIFCQERNTIDSQERYLNHSHLRVKADIVYIGLGVHTYLYSAEISD